MLVRIPIPRFAALAAALVATLFAPAAFSDLVSEDSSFGADTITHDTVTDLRWLDLTESAGYSHAAILTETQPGGVFAGYRLATTAEVTELFTTAGIDVSVPVQNHFVAQNYTPIVALAALVGQLGSNGNCGSGCTFDYTQGWIDAPPPALPGFFTIAGLSWFDNTAGQSPGDPSAPVGRVALDNSHAESSDPDNAAWLVVPEPGASALGATALGALLAARRGGARHSEA